jgi:hypothetical protein
MRRYHPMHTSSADVHGVIAGVDWSLMAIDLMQVMLE